MTGLPSVDVRSIGAGGGSIIWADDGGLLHVGPQSAEAQPGPACFGNGGVEPTITDAAFALGYLDEHLIGGRLRADKAAALAALASVGERLDLTEHEVAAAAFQLVTDHMVHAIEELTIADGIDPATAVLVVGGGAGGLNACAVGRAVGCSTVVVPHAGPVLSATGGLVSGYAADFSITYPQSASLLDRDGVGAVIDELIVRSGQFAATCERGHPDVALFVTARYESQVWELDLEIEGVLASDGDELTQKFHALHERTFGFSDHGSDVEFGTWRASVAVVQEQPMLEAPQPSQRPNGAPAIREVLDPRAGWSNAEVHDWDRLASDVVLEGPALVTSPFTVVVLGRGDRAHRSRRGALIVDLEVPVSRQ